MMEFDFIRLHQTVMKRYQETSFYAGLGYHLDYHYHIHDNLLDLDATDGDGQALTSHYVYSVANGFDPQRYVLSGVSLNLLYDSRDNAVNPYSGRYAFANIRMNPTFLGSDQSSSLLWLEYRDYIHFSEERPRHLLGFWTYGWFQVGQHLPYMDLPAVGWDQFGRSGRAYTQGRFRGENLMYFETEYRFPLLPNSELLGGVVFVNATTATNKAAGIQLFNYLDPAAGVGLRVMINKTSRANLNIDYAWGKYGAQGFYFGLNEVF
jgi:outer membrane protein assembly factor BamA